MNPLVQIFVLVGIVGINGFLALSEMALVSARKTRLQKLADDGIKGAITALALSESPTRFLASLQICITILGIAAGAWGGANLSGPVELWFARSIPSLAHLSHGLGVGFVVAIETIFMVLLGELFPKRLALFFPERIAVTVAPVIDALGTIIAPAAHLFSRTTDQIIKVMRLKPNRQDESHVTEDEIKIMVEQGAEAGVFDKSEESMLKRALDFGDLSGSEVMTPRTRLFTFNAEHFIEAVIDRMLKFGFSNYPVFFGQNENLVGIVSIKKVFAALRKSRNYKLSDLMVPAVFMPDSAKAGKIFETMRLKRQPMIVLIDEFGGVAGIVTATDLMTAVVGEVPGGHQEDSPRFVQREDGSWLVDGRVSLSEVEKELGFVTPPEVEEDYQTLSGLMMHYLDSVPKEGQFIEMPGWRFEVIDMDYNRIDKVLVARTQGLESALMTDSVEGDLDAYPRS